MCNIGGASERTWPVRMQPCLAPAQRAPIVAAVETQGQSAIVTAAEVPAWQPGFW